MEVVRYGKYDERYIGLNVDLAVSVAGIAVTVISIIVTVISIVQTTRNTRHKKSNRSDQS